MQMCFNMDPWTTKNWINNRLQADGVPNFTLDFDDGEPADNLFLELVNYANELKVDQAKTDTLEKDRGFPKKLKRFQYEGACVYDQRAYRYFSILDPEIPEEMTFNTKLTHDVTICEAFK